jgi:hypothetical protein
LITKNPLIGLQSQIASVRALITGDYQNYLWDIRQPDPNNHDMGL